MRRLPPFRFVLLPFLLVLLLTGCYERAAKAVHDTFAASDSQDSLALVSGHYYSDNYNFIVRADSLVLLSQQPEEAVADFPTDTFALHHREHIAVADIRVIPTDTIDTVWVQVANAEALFGWLHEGDLLVGAVPDDPISQFISFFDHTYIVLFLAFFVLTGAIYLVVKLLRRSVPLVHVRDINSFYPTLFCLVVATAAVLYASILMFAPHEWQMFYFYPTLNPFAVPPLVALFLGALWAMIIILIAVVDDVFKLLPFGDALLYLGGTLAVAAVDYIIFTLTTRVFVGYVLYAAYVTFALYRYFHYAYRPYACGRCGARLRHKGVCPYCGTMNE